MKVQRLIEKYKRYEGKWNAKTGELARQIFLQDLEQLDETKPVKVPQFVADWYEEHKDNLEFYIFDYVYRFDQQKNSDFKDWLDGFKTEALQTLVNMRQFGYEVEKEPKYTVKVKGISGYGCYLNKGLLSKEYFFESKAEIGGCRTKNTRKQLEDDDLGWVFDCEGIEIEEVE